MMKRKCLLNMLALAALLISFNACSTKDDAPVVDDDPVVDEALLKYYSKEMKPIAREMYILQQKQSKGEWAKAEIETAQPKPEASRYWMAREKDRKAMFLQLLQQYGWGMLQYRNERINEEIKSEELPDQYYNDLLAIYAAEYTNADLTTFFKDWNYPLSLYAQQYLKNYSEPTRFWDTFDKTKEPQETSETPKGVAHEKVIPGKDYAYDHSIWSASATSKSVEGTGNGSASCLLDGKLDTYYQSSSTATYPHEIMIEFKDKDGQPVEVEFNYIYLAQRNQSTPGPKAFTIQINPVADAPDVWVDAEDGANFYLTRDYNPTLGNVYQKIYISKALKVFGVKLIFSSSLPATEGQSDVATTLSLAELGVGLLK